MGLFDLELKPLGLQGSAYSRLPKISSLQEQNEQRGLLPPLQSWSSQGAAPYGVQSSEPLFHGTAPSSPSPAGFQSQVRAVDNALQPPPAGFQSQVRAVDNALDPTNNAKEFTPLTKPVIQAPKQTLQPPSEPQANDWGGAVSSTGPKTIRRAVETFSTNSAIADKQRQRIADAGLRLQVF